MFIHYGCAILKHRANESDFFLKLALIGKLVCAVLIVRASLLGSYWDLLAPLIAFATIAVLLSLYLWAHGLTLVTAGKRLSAIKAKDIVSIIKKTL